MRSGDTLIKLAKHKVEAVQKLLSAARSIHADLSKKLIDLDNAKEKERVMASNNPEYAANFNAYLKSWNLQRANVEASMAGVEDQIKALDADLAEAFEEQKKFETLKERRMAHELENRKKQETKQMDEFAITRMARG